MPTVNFRYPTNLPYPDDHLGLNVMRLQSPYNQDFLLLYPRRFEIIWIESGTTVLSVGRQKLQLYNNTLVCIVPNQASSLRFENPVTGYRISLCTCDDHPFGLTPDFTTIMRSSDPDGSSLIAYPPHELAMELIDTASKLKKEYDNRLSLRSEILDGYLQILMMYILRTTHAETRTTMHRDDQLVSRFMSLLKRNFLTSRKVTDYADELCISANYLNKLVKQVTGFPASHHIQQCLLQEAKRYALLEDAPLKTVAATLGFTDCAHFSKFFKRLSGMTYTAFKARRCSLTV